MVSLQLDTYNNFYDENGNFDTDKFSQLTEMTLKYMDKYIPKWLDTNNKKFAIFKTKEEEQMVVVFTNDDKFVTMFIPFQENDGHEEFEKVNMVANTFLPHQFMSSINITLHTILNRYKYTYKKSEFYKNYVGPIAEFKNNLMACYVWYDKGKRVISLIAVTRSLADEKKHISDVVNISDGTLDRKIQKGHYGDKTKIDVTREILANYFTQPVVKIFGLMCYSIDEKFSMQFDNEGCVYKIYIYDEEYKEYANAQFGAPYTIKWFEENVAEPYKFTGRVTYYRFVDLTKSNACLVVGIYVNGNRAEFWNCVSNSTVTEISSKNITST